MPVPMEFSTPATTQDVAVSGTTARTTTDFKTRKIMVTSTVACRIKLGDSAVTAALTDVMILANTPYYLDSGGNPRLAVISASTGTLSVTEMV